MCWGKLITILRDHDRSITESRIRWAINSGKVSRPPRDHSLRFDFGPEHVEELLRYFANKDNEGNDHEPVSTNN
jgi:hypothetical protein